MKQRLTQIRSPWRRLRLSLAIACLLLADRFFVFFFPRARVHWIGYYRRARRLERPLTVLVFLLAMLLLEPRDVAFWSTFSGGMVSIFLTLYTVYQLVPHKRTHWIY